jgi:hypothetical protein
MNIGWVIAFIVLILCVVAMFFSTAMPAWATVVLIGALALSIVLSPLTVKWPWTTA